ncbi:MAG: hypothetical protein ABS882_03005 [Lysinibacillus sp.]
MKNGVFVLGIIIVIVIITYNPGTKILTGEVSYVGKQEIVINCPPKQPKFKPSDDIGRSCTIILDEETIIVPHKKVVPGQMVAVELVKKTKIENATAPLVAAKIKILTD